MGVRGRVGERPKNRRWNTWRPDEEDHTPVAPAALQCHPLVNKLSCLVVWKFGTKADNGEAR